MTKFIKILCISLLFSGITITSLTTWAMKLPQETHESSNPDTLGPQLIQAVVDDNYFEVRRLLENNAPVDFSEEHGITPLHIASERGKQQIAKILLAHHANVNIKSRRNCTALLLAAEKCHPQIISLLLEANANPNTPNVEGVTPLMLAAEHGCIQGVHALLKHNAIINFQANGADNVTALHQAAQNGHFEIVKMLLAVGADVNIKRTNGYTPLIIAAQNGHDQVINLLLAHHSNVDAQDDKLTTALNIATYHGHSDILKILIKAGAQRDLADDNGFTPLMNAAQNGHTDCVKELVWENADPFIQAPGMINTFALRQAAQNGHIPAVELLLTEISKADAERIQHNFTGLLAINRMEIKDDASWQIHQWEPQEKEKAPQKNLLLKKPRQLITRQILNELTQERMMRVQRMLAIRDAYDATAYDVAQGHNHRELVDLLDPDNACSQEKIRTMIEKNIKRLLFSPTSKPSGVL